MPHADTRDDLAQRAIDRHDERVYAASFERSGTTQMTWSTRKDWLFVPKQLNMDASRCT
jgi:hypothetical protein